MTFNDRFSATDFSNLVTQQSILLNGSRAEIIQWLVWNDPNGIWSDEDSAAEGWQSMTLEQARASMRKAIGDTAEKLKIAYSADIDFDPILPADANEAGCKEWLRKLCRDFGLGFHPDTPASDYRNWEGLPLPPGIVTAIDNSLDRTFELLGEEVPYEICADVAEEMLAELTAAPDSDGNSNYPVPGQMVDDRP